MMIEKHIKEFGDFLSSIKTRITPGQLYKAKNMLENVLDSIQRLERSNEKLNLEMKGIYNEEYPSTFQKSMDLLVFLGFDIIEFTTHINRQVIEFMQKNRASIEKSGPLTAERIQNIANMIKYTEQSTGAFPKTMKEVIEAYTELKTITDAE